MIYLYEVKRNLYKEQRVDARKAMMHTVAPLKLRFYASLIDILLLTVPMILAIIFNVIIGVELLDPMFVTIVIGSLVLTAVFIALFVFIRKGQTPGYAICGISIVSTLTGKEVDTKQYLTYLFTGSFSVVPRVKGLLEVYSLLGGEYQVSLSMRQACVIPVKNRIYKLFLEDYGTKKILESAEVELKKAPPIL